MRGEPIPFYDLYAESRIDPTPGFLHAERVRTRARVHDWSIRSHRHAGMWQALIVTNGGGEATLEMRREAIAPPWFAWVPAGVVHAYDFAPETEGVVVTAARDLLEASLARDGFAPFSFLRERPFAAALPADVAATADLSRAMEAILTELGLPGFGGRAAVAAYFDLLLVAVARLGGAEREAGTVGRRGDGLFQRFRALLEARFREHWTLSRYADALATTPDGLYAAVRAACGRSPQAVLHDRLLVEAKRSLLYTSMSISEIAYDLGFEDPAYFTRFFARRAGRPPSAFREEAGASGV